MGHFQTPPLVCRRQLDIFHHWFHLQIPRWVSVRVTINRNPTNPNPVKFLQNFLCFDIPSFDRKLIETAERQEMEHVSPMVFMY